MAAPAAPSSLFVAGSPSAVLPPSALPSAASPSTGGAGHLKLLHTSDLQLDAPFTFLGEKGAAHRQQLRATFRRIVEMARQGGYDLLLIAGDLFNDNRPCRATLSIVQESLAALPVPVCILPGNHDCYDRTSVYRRDGFSPNVHILTEMPSVLDFPALNLTVSGNAILSRHGADSVLRNLQRRPSRRWHVAMAHGNVCVPGYIDDPERPISPEAIAACDVDYLALGDWHAFACKSQQGVAAFYSGAPEPTSLDASGSGYVASVTLSDEGVSVEPLRVGATETARLSLDVTGRTEREVIVLIAERAKPSLMLDVVLHGSSAVEEVIDSERVCAEAAGGFYWLRVTSQAHPAVEHMDAVDYPETHVIGQYVRLLKQRIDSAASDGERTRAERALQLGVALLRGHESLV